MSKIKKLKIPEDQLELLIEKVAGCFATNKITVEGMPVGFMYREEQSEAIDSGWRFFSGTETQDYVDDKRKSDFYPLNTIANYDPAIIPYLDMPEGTELERNEDGTFSPVES